MSFRIFAERLEDMIINNSLSHSKDLIFHYIRPCMISDLSPGREIKTKFKAYACELDLVAYLEFCDSRGRCI